MGQANNHAPYNRIFLAMTFTANFVGLLLRWVLTVAMLIGSGHLQAQSAATEPSTQASIAVLPDIHRDYERFLRGRDLHSLSYYGGDYARRDVIELVLMLQALKLGGFDQPVVFADEENYFRSIRNLIDGKSLSIAGTLWQQDLIPQQEKLYITAPVVKDGQFVVGLYTAPKNLSARSSTTLTALTQLSVVTSRQWQPDLQTLEQLGFKRIMFTPNWLNIARMLNAGRADLTLSPITNSADKSLKVEGIRLVPIEGVKIAIRGSRHWAASRKHPLGDAFYQALVKGMQQLQDQGTIERAYRECGFFHPDLKDWKLLNAQAGD